MNRRILSSLFLFAAAAVAAPDVSPTFELFSASEAAAWNTPGGTGTRAYGTRELPAPGVPNCHAIPSETSPRDPQIRIVAPVLDKPLVAPIDIELKFIAASDAPVKPNTFKVCYVGIMVMDLTKRVTDRVSVSAEGLRVTGAQLPRGHHHLVMMIADQKGDIGAREAVFDIQ